MFDNPFDMVIADIDKAAAAARPPEAPRPTPGSAAFMRHRPVQQPAPKQLTPEEIAAEKIERFQTAVASAVGTTGRKKYELKQWSRSDLAVAGRLLQYLLSVEKAELQAQLRQPVYDAIYSVVRSMVEKRSDPLVPFGTFQIERDIQAKAIRGSGVVSLGDRRSAQPKPHHRRYGGKKGKRRTA